MLAQETAEGLSESEIRWLMWGAIALAVLVVVWLIPSFVMFRGRDRDIERAARSSGMRFQAEDGPGLGRLRFDLLVPSNGLKWNAFNVITSDRSGAPAHSFDIWVWTEVVVSEDDQYRNPFNSEPPSKKVVRQTRAKSASGCIVTLPIHAPRLLIVRENFASKLLATVSRVDLDLESDLFNRTYHVLTSDRRFAQSVLDARVLDLIVQGEGRMEFEFFGNKLLIRTPTLEPELMPGLVAYGEQFPNVISALVRERYKDASAYDA